MGLYCTGVGEILEDGWLFNPSCKQFDQLAVHSGKQKNQTQQGSQETATQSKKKKENAPLAAVPDVNGCVGQDFAVAVPAAVGGGAPASRVVSTDLAENLVFAVLPQVQLQVRVTLAVARREAETPHSVDLDEVQVKLKRSRRREEL